jgi:hypothetical protein
MRLKAGSSAFRRSKSRRRFLASALATFLLGACATGSSGLPEPRTIVIRSGSRLHPEMTRMEEIDGWYRPQMENIEADPTFMIETVPRDTPSYPWESLLIEGTTARIGVEVTKSPEAARAFMIYAHLHLMNRMGRLDEFLPGAGGQEGYLLERALLARVADVWFYGRGLFNATAYGPLEELLFSKEAGYLDAFLLTARGDEFEEERQRWLQEEPEGLERYRRWFVDTFEREPPGLREGS